jgi:hypothetical protein
MTDVNGLDWVRGTRVPFAGSATVDVRPWEDAALDSPERFSMDLAEMGLPQPEIEEGLELRTVASKEVEAAIADFWKHHPRQYWQTPPEVQREVQLIYDSARGRARERVHDWLARRVITVETRLPVKLHLPLFLLSAPSAIGCTAEFTTSTNQSNTLGWSVKIGGMGVGSEADVTITTSASFEASTGQKKLIFLPVNVVVETIVVARGGSKIRSHRIDLAGLRDQRNAPGAMLLDAEAKPALGDRVQTYPLANDSSDSTATYVYRYVQGPASNIKIGIPIQGIDVGLTSSTKMESAVEITFKLRSGIDYQLFRTAQGDGVLWG